MRILTTPAIKDNSTITETLSAQPPKIAAQRWAGLSTGGKIAVGISVGAVALALIGLSTIYCIGQRQTGRQERALADASFAKDTAEMMAYRSQGGRWGSTNSS